MTTRSNYRPPARRPVYDDVDEIAVERAVAGDLDRPALDALSWAEVDAVLRLGDRQGLTDPELDQRLRMKTGWSNITRRRRHIPRRRPTRVRTGVA